MASRRLKITYVVALFFVVGLLGFICVRCHRRCDEQTDRWMTMFKGFDPIADCDIRPGRMIEEYLKPGREVNDEETIPCPRGGLGLEDLEYTSRGLFKIERIDLHQGSHKIMSVIMTMPLGHVSETEMSKALNGCELTLGNLFSTSLYRADRPPCYSSPCRFWLVNVDGEKYNCDIDLRRNGEMPRLVFSWDDLGKSCGE